MHYEIQDAGWRDLGELRSLEYECFAGEAWPLLDLISVLSLPGIVRLKVVTEGRMAGFAAGDRHPREGVGWVTTLGVRPVFQRRGIGTALLQACESRIGLPVIRLCVARTNSVAIRIYQRAGYRQIQTWPAYYQSGEDALVMEKRNFK